MQFEDHLQNGGAILSDLEKEVIQFLTGFACGPPEHLDLVIVILLSKDPPGLSPEDKIIHPLGIIPEKILRELLERVDDLRACLLEVSTSLFQVHHVGP